MTDAITGPESRPTEAPTTLRTPPFSALPLPKRLWILAQEAWARALRPQCFVAERLGARWLIDQENQVDRHLYARGVWEPEQLDMLRSLIARVAPVDRPGVFLDIGAHGGFYAILMTRQTIGAGPTFERLICVEADPQNAAQLRANLFLNELSGQIEVIEAAAADAAGALRLRIGPGENRGVSRLARPAPSASGDQSRYRTVPALRLDSLDLPADAFLVAKIDVEGAEIAVLEGMSGLLETGPCVLQIEADDPDAPEVVERLAALGFDWAASVDTDRFFVREA